MSSRDIVLARIQAALGTRQLLDDDVLDRQYRRHSEDTRETIVAQFAERVAEYRASIRRVEAGQLPGAIADACGKRGARSLVIPDDIPDAWLPNEVEIVRDAPDAPVGNEQLNCVDGVLTGCSLGIAQTGTIVLDGGPRQGRRAISLLPDYHLCVVYGHQVVGLVAEAIAKLGDAVGRRGGPITFISGPSATSDIELNRVEGVHGPRALDVLLVEGHTEA